MAAIVVLIASSMASSVQAAARRSVRAKASGIAIGNAHHRRRHRHRHRHRHHRAHHRFYGHHGRAADGCPNASTPLRAAPAQAIRDAVVCLVNGERSAHGLPSLHESGQLTRSAQGWTDEMMASGFFSHGSDFGGRIAGTGYRFRGAGENIASGFVTARGVMRAWMGDVGHCQNILNPTYRDIGVGIGARAIPGAARGSGTWTQDFGLRSSQSAPSQDWGPADGCPYA